MTVTINAVTSTGLTTTADGSGVVKLQSNGVTTNALAWVNWNGYTGSGNTIRAAYNVGSITKNGSGDYTVNFTNALTDANYIPVFSTTGQAANDLRQTVVIYGSYTTGPTTKTTSALRINTGATSVVSPYDVFEINVAIFGN